MKSPSGMAHFQVRTVCSEGVYLVAFVVGFFAPTKKKHLDEGAYLSAIYRFLTELTSLYTLFFVWENAPNPKPLLCSKTIADMPIFLGRTAPLHPIPK